MADQGVATPIDEIEAALVLWDPVAEFAHVFTRDDYEPTVDAASLDLANASGTYNASFALNTINRAIEDTRNNFEAILSGEVGAEIFAGEETLPDVWLTAQVERGEPSEGPGERENAEDPANPSSSERGHGNESNDNSAPFSSSGGESASESPTSTTERVRTGEFMKYIVEANTYRPNKNPSTQILLRFKAPARQEIIAFSTDIIDCDSLNVEVYKYNGAIERHSQEVGNECCSVDVDVSDLGRVEDIKTVGVYLSKAGEVAGLIMSYIFDDNETIS